MTLFVLHNTIQGLNITVFELDIEETRENTVVTDLFIRQVSHLITPLALRRCQAQMVIDGAEWIDFAYWWSCVGKGLRAACKAG